MPITSLSGKSRESKPIVNLSSDSRAISRKQQKTRKAKKPYCFGLAKTSKKPCFKKQGFLLQ